MVDSSSPSNLNPRQLSFANYYLTGLTASEAAIRAGYKPAWAAKNVSRLLRDPKIAAYIDGQKAKASEKTGVTLERVIQELAAIAFANFGDVAEWGEEGLKFKDSSSLSRETLASVASVEVKAIEGEHGSSKSQKVSQHNKLAALKVLGEHLGMFKARATDDTGGELDKIAEALGLSEHHFG